MTSDKLRDLRSAFEKAKVLWGERRLNQRFSLNNKYHTLEIQIQAFYSSGNFVQIYAKAISFGTFPISWRITAAGTHNTCEFAFSAKKNNDKDNTNTNIKRNRMLLFHNDFFGYKNIHFFL